MSLQRRGHCFGSRVIPEDVFRQHYVDVKCKIYEPQVFASTTVKHTADTPSLCFCLLLFACLKPRNGAHLVPYNLLLLLQDTKRQRLYLYFSFTCKVTAFFLSRQAAAADGQAHAKAGNEDVGQHLSSATPTADPAVSCARSSRGTVVNQPASVRSSPAASSCPSPRRHNIGISKLGLWLSEVRMSSLLKDVMRTMYGNNHSILILFNIYIICSTVIILIQNKFFSPLRQFCNT